MSHFDNQLKAFKSSVTSSSQKISNKRIVGHPGTSTPSPAPSQASTASKNEIKRKRPDASSVVYSQPADTGTGHNIMTQVTYAIDYLKQKNTPQRIEDLFSYLSLQHFDESHKRAITTILMGHKKVDYDPNGFDGQGSFAFRPFHNIRSGDQLLAHLQNQRTAQGLHVRELRDGWPEAEATIRELEAQRRLLVTRNKRDDSARMVWLDDPTLQVSIDEEFKKIWSNIKLPEPNTLAEELEKNGLTPTNKSRVVKAKPKVQEKKTKKPRRSGKTTNVHMLGFLRDYSHLQK
jgi:transcription initiation factor TFIIE subunit beta